MDYRPIVAYVILIAVCRYSESIVSLRTGSWKKKPKWDWTFPLVVVPFILVIVCPVLEYLYRESRHGPISYATGGCLLLAATFLRTKGHLDLKKGFSMFIEKVEGQELVETGLYRHIRHPLYLGTACMFLGCPVFLAAYRSLGWSLLGLLSLYVRIRKEEQFLLKHMPGYKEYRKRTWALIPKVF